MSEPGDNLIKSIVSRVENVEAEMRARSEDRKEIYAEAKSHGFNVKALKSAVSRRKADAKKAADHEAQVDLYMAALSSLVRPT